MLKIKQATDVRKYAHPVRGTRAWKKLYNQRTAVERVNSYLKHSYQLNKTTYYNAQQVKIEHLLIQLTYNLKRYANDRLTKKEKEKKVAA